MNDDEPAFWVFRRRDGHAITSARTDHYDVPAMVEEEMWDPDASRPDGEWSAETREEWDTNTRECLRGRCEHTAPQRMRRGRVESTPAKPAATEETWQSAMVRVLPMLESVKAQMLAVWNDVKPAVAAMAHVVHTLRVVGDHADLCAAGRTGRCFCACRACTNSDGVCACAHCDHEERS